jgi:hypothetical protein
MLTRTITAITALAVLMVPAHAADFTQPARDPKFIQSARRQDKELVHFYGRQIPGGITFNHLGSYQAVVHRIGQKRPVTLVPVTSLPYDSIETLQKAARTTDVVVGALRINYGMHNPPITPGVLLLVFDGLRVHLRNVHGEDLTEFDATLGPIPTGQKLGVVQGAVNSGSSSLAEIGEDSTLRLYLQLGTPDGKGKTAANKAQLAFKIDGLVEDDDSPPTVLVKPEEPQKGAAKPAK